MADGWQPSSTAPRDGTLIVIHHWIKVPGAAPKRFYALARWGDDGGSLCAPGADIIWRDEEGAALGLEEVEWVWAPHPRCTRARSLRP